MRRILYIATLVIALSTAYSCSDDDYTLSASVWLDMSVDTISFDTVFSNVPSAMQDFWVYNRSKSDVRLTSIAQQRGNQSGFRVNVDGIYLGQTTGYQTAEVEIRQGDSIRVFVELTANANGADVPQSIEDNIVFTLASGNVQRVNLRACSWDAIILNNPVVSVDTTFTGEKPIVVYGGLKIDSLATLTLAAGTTLYLRDEAGIDVYGTLLSKGEADNEVVLRGYRLDNMFDYLPYDRVSGQWQGIHFYESSYDNRMDYTDLHSAFNGIEIDSADVCRSKLVLNASTVHNCQGYCIVNRGANIEMYNCQVTNALDDCFCIDGGAALIDNCTFAQFYPYDSARGVAFRFLSATAPVVFFCENSLITGYSNNEVQMGDTLNITEYGFDNCVIRLEVDETVDSLLFTRNIYETDEDTLVGGRKHFVEIDAYNMKYNFRLAPESTAIDAADPLTALPTDRDGRERDDSPDIGAYEFVYVPIEDVPEETEEDTEEKDIEEE